MNRAAGVDCARRGRPGVGQPTGPRGFARQVAWHLVVVMGILSSHSVAASELRFDFQADQVGQTPEGFDSVPVGRGGAGKWRVMRDGQNQVLAHAGRTSRRQRFALALVENCNLKDVKLAVKIKWVAGEKEAAGGIVWRYQDSDNYLVARLDFQNNRFRLYRVVDGNLATFGREDQLKLEPDTWYTLRVEHKGNTVKVYLDDEVLIMTKDRHFRHAGKVGLWTKAGAESYFDDFRIRKVE